ncbi:interferon alpha-inducible protein 27-like protein 2A isoform X2 [Erinaceus europaeus]|uniref:Interferon alpha-inducible protein 27-like protein 2A isoform X2 n=1 Tax=Erinaceus europaeus TaxID=9365 RepID=A0A1S3A4D1_ERIEU|nr:interferon alpha-inducible protein 27-like protein 2A isoform X2 [Erinaceus europaeus]
MVLTQVLAVSLSSKFLSAAGLAQVGKVAGLSSLGNAVASRVAVSSALSTLGPMLGSLQGSILLVSPVAAKVAAAAVGGVVAVQATPVILGAMGFTTAGIAASSIAAKMMSVAAIANGGGVASGSLVATLQSMGAAGLALTSKVTLGSAGALVGAILA